MRISEVTFCKRGRQRRFATATVTAPVRVAGREREGGQEGRDKSSYLHSLGAAAHTQVGMAASLLILQEVDKGQ